MTRRNSKSYKILAVKKKKDTPRLLFQFGLTEISYYAGNESFNINSIKSKLAI